MKNMILTCLALFCFIMILQSQDSKLTKKEERKLRDRYLAFGPGVSFIKVIDHNTSPLLYKGPSFVAANLGYLVHSERIIKTFESEFSFSYLHARTETPWYNPRNTSYYIVFRYDILYRLRQIVRNRINWYLGPEINVNGHFRVDYKYGNSAFTFDNYNGAGLATRFEFPLGYKARKINLWFLTMNRRNRDLRLSWQLSMPLVSLMIRPTYVTITNFIAPELQTKVTRDHLDGGFLVPFNLRSQTELYYILHNRNILKLSYIWNFYHHDPGTNKVQSAYHGIMFSLLFKFNNKVTK